jgi:hypothetical protein
MKFGDDKSKAPASFLFLAGAWLILSLFVSNQLLPPTSRIRLAAIDGAMAGMMLTELTDTMFFRLRFVIFNEFASDRNLNPRFRLAIAAESERRTGFLVE